MRKYIENDKASKARRKGKVVVGTTTKAKAKELVGRYSRLSIYGTYLDGMVDVGYKLGFSSMDDKWINFYKGKVVA